MALLIALAMSGCTSIEVEQMRSTEGLALMGPDGATPEAEYLIRPGDDLDIKLFYTQELNEQLMVRPDGYISLQLIDEVKAAGLTPKQLDDLLTQKYSAHLKDPSVSVIVRSFKGFRAYVGGEVAVPQVIPLEGGMSVMQAIYRAGGTLTSADMASIVLIRRGDRGQPIPYHLDLSDEAIAAAKPDTQIALAPADVIYIPRSPIANANLWVQQYITDLVLFKGIQFGVGAQYIVEDGSNNQ
ncbi:polysaccharide biosynthesis/export family protein [Atopomonas hussainii]|uniref:polysaccharide biosynthesis/export family protein n=1 Tax=Atopomonas hussainii TaxID=1429083 RepID=UPI0008FFE06E|nr:polysaccharide biosynthesis/export family protein [Atopomonas hussainii]